MRKGLLLALVGALLLLPLGTALAAKQEVQSVNPATLKGMLGDPQLMVIDVRTPSAFADSKTMIKGAVRQDPGKVPTWGKTLPKDKKIVVYCS
jgi:rhodanese-related sulfurtransferase